MTNLTVPISAKDIGQAGEQIQVATQAGAEMLELRTDYFSGLNVESVKELVGIAKAPGLPIIVTCRDKRQGGVGEWAEQLRIEVLSGGLEVGVEFIDLEYENFKRGGNQEKIKTSLEKSPAAKLILSAHNFEGRFADIEKLYDEISRAFPAGIVKLVYKANHINDCFEAFDLLYGKKGGRIIFAMGEAGMISRIIAKKLGSFVTFASIDDEAATAPGQVTIHELKNLYRYDAISSETEFYGIIGCPVAHSMGPAVHNNCFDKAGLNKVYLPLLVGGGGEEFGRFIRNVLSRDWLDFKGFSVTIPHKVNAFEFVKERGGFIEPLAARIGAVNTVMVGNDGKLSAYNTDYAGAMTAILSSTGWTKKDLSNLPTTVIGAGGAARAVVAGLTDAGAKVVIYNRTIERGERLAEEFDCDFRPLSMLSGMDAKLVVNCTNIGMSPNVEDSPLPSGCIKKDMVIFDTVYNPVETGLLREGKQAGARTVGGAAMFVGQAMAQFKFFTGTEADAELMRKTVLDCLSR